MPLDIGDALSDGVHRTVQRNGLLLAAAFFVVGLPGALVPIDVGSPAPGAPPTVAPGTSPVFAALVGLLTTLLTIAVSIVALRTFVIPETERVPPEHYRRNVGFAFLNFVVGGIAFVILVAIGFVLFVIPGLFLLVALYFWSLYVAVEDENFVSAFGDSWRLTSGHRLRLFVLGFVVVFVTLVVNALFGIFGVLGYPVGALFGQVGSALTTTFSLATAARAYDQLTPTAATDEPVDRNGVDDEWGSAAR